MIKVIIFDLDGTLANIDVRRDISLKPNGKLNWEIFASPDSILNFDTPNDPVIIITAAFIKVPKPGNNIFSLLYKFKGLLYFI